jgi:ribokinase
MAAATRYQPEYGAVVDLDARLTVLGSLNMDISVTVPSLPGPGATVLGGPAAFAPGGKGANQAVAAARLGAEANVAVRMVGCVGDDDFGRALRAALTAEGIDDRAVRTAAEAPTGIAMITVDEAGENIITVAPGANHEVGAPEIAVIRQFAAAAGPGSANVLVISAEVPVPAILAALSATSPASHGAPGPGTPKHTSDPAGPTDPGDSGAERPGDPGAERGDPAEHAARPPRRLTVLNLAPAPPREEAAGILRAGPDWLVVNESEAAAVLARPVSGLSAAAAAAADLVAAGARNAVVTAGAAGAAYHGPKANSEHQEVSGTIAAFPVRAIDTVGAGDTFVGALAVALAAGIAPAEAVTAAAAAGAAAATRPGTQAGMPRPADIRAATGYEWPLAR